MKTLKVKSVPSGQVEDEDLNDVTSELKRTSSRKRRISEGAFFDLVSEHVTTSRMTKEEANAIERSRIKREDDKYALDLVNKDIEIRKLDVEEKRLEFERKKYEDELELRKQQQELLKQQREQRQKEKDEKLIAMLSSFGPLVTRLAEKEQKTLDKVNFIQLILKINGLISLTIQVFLKARRT